MKEKRKGTSGFVRRSNVPECVVFYVETSTWTEVKEFVSRVSQTSRHPDIRNDFECSASDDEGKSSKQGTTIVYRIRRIGYFKLGRTSVLVPSSV